MRRVKAPGFHRNTLPKSGAGKGRPRSARPSKECAELGRGGCFYFRWSGVVQVRSSKLTASEVCLPYAPPFFSLT